MTGKELIEWIQKNHAEDMKIKVKTGEISDNGFFYLYDDLKPDDIWIMDNEVSF